MKLSRFSHWTLAPLVLTLLASTPDGQAASEIETVPPPPLTFSTKPAPPPIPVTLKKIVGGLGHATSIANAGDDRLFVTQQEGLIFVVQNGVRRTRPFLDLRQLVSTGGELGLLSIAFPPDYAESGRFYVDYTNRDEEVVVARYQVSAVDPNRATPGSARILLTIPKPFTNHNGGQLQFGRDGYLYISVGDGGGFGDADCNAQQTANLLGKILRIDVSGDTYTIPDGNPFPASEIWLLGLRNPWKFSFDRLTGDLWIGDVGQTRREEINFLPGDAPAGANFGWKPMEGNACYSNAGCPASTPPCRSSQFLLPVLDYNHRSNACAVTGGYVSRGPSLPHAYGTYFFGDLCGDLIFAADRQAGTWSVRSFTVPPGGFVTFGESIGGDLFTANRRGDLYQVVPLHPVDTTGLYDPAAGRFLFKDLHVTGPRDRDLAFGTPGSAEIPVAGDWDGDGKTTVGFWDPVAREFRLKDDIVFAVTPPADDAIPVVGDWNGDKKDSVGFYDRATSRFHLTNRTAGADALEISFAFGQGGIPITGDWNGDGRDTVGLYAPALGLFTFRNQLASGAPDARLRFGGANSSRLPVAGDWNGDGRDAVGLFNPATATFQLKDAIEAGPANRTVRITGAPAGGRPVVGEW